MYLSLIKWNQDGLADDSYVNIYNKPLDNKNNALLKVDLIKIRKRYPDSWVLDTKFYGNHVFFELMYTKNKTDKRTIINYNLRTDKWIDISSNLSVEINTMFTIFNDKIIFGNQDKIYECDYNGKQNRKIINCGEIISGYSDYTPYSNDGKHLFITPSNSYKDYSDTIIVANKKYRTNKQKLPESFIPYIGFDENAFIIIKETEKNKCSAVFWIDKSNYTMSKIYEIQK